MLNGYEKSSKILRIKETVITIEGVLDKAIKEQ